MRKISNAIGDAIDKISDFGSAAADYIFGGGCLIVLVLGGVWLGVTLIGALIALTGASEQASKVIALIIIVSAVIVYFVLTKDKRKIKRERDARIANAKKTTYTYHSTADKARFDLDFTNQAISNDEAKIKEIRDKMQHLEAERNSKSNEQFEAEYRELNSRLSSAMQHLEFNRKIKQEQLEKYNDYI